MYNFLEKAKDVEVPTCFDYTMLDCYQVCKRRFFFRHVLGLCTKSRMTAVEFGHAIHEALDVWHLTHNAANATAKFVEDWVEAGGDSRDDNKRTQAKGEKILKGYYSKYAQEPFTVLHSEVPFQIKIGEYDYIGRMDKIVDWNGACPMDHKTSSSLGYTTFDAYNPNMQIDGYIFATRKLFNPDCYKAYIDLLQVAKTKEDYARHTETRMEDQLEQFPALFKDLADEVIRDYGEGKWNPRYSSCTYYAQCPYRKICRESQSIWDRIVETFYSVDKWDPRKGVNPDDVKKVEA